MTKTKASYHVHTCLSKKEDILEKFFEDFREFLWKVKINIIFQIHYDECNIKMIMAYADQIA